MNGRTRSTNLNAILRIWLIDSIINVQYNIPYLDYVLNICVSSTFIGFITLGIVNIIAYPKASPDLKSWFFVLAIMAIYVSCIPQKQFCIYCKCIKAYHQKIIYEKNSQGYEVNDNDIKLAKSYRDISQLEKGQLNESPEPQDGAAIESAFNFAVDELEAGVNDDYVRLYPTLLFCVNGKIMARYVMGATIFKWQSFIGSVVCGVAVVGFLTL